MLRAIFHTYCRSVLFSECDVCWRNFDIGTLPVKAMKKWWQRIDVNARLTMDRVRSFIFLGTTCFVPQVMNSAASGLPSLSAQNMRRSSFCLGLKFHESHFHGLIYCTLCSPHLRENILEDTWWMVIILHLPAKANKASSWFTSRSA